MLSKKEVNSEDRLWRVIMFPLSPASSNVHFMLLMSFFMVFCTEALKMNPIVVGLVVTVSRVFNACTDPILGALLDRTETKFGKFRPFMVCGSLIMNITFILMFQVSFAIPQNSRIVWIIVCYAIWDLGYSMMTAVNKSALSVVTKNPKHRPISGIAGGIYTTLVMMLLMVGITPYLKQHGGFGSQAGWSIISILIVILNLVLLSVAIIGIAGRDKPEFFRRGNAKKEKVKLKDYIEVIKINRPLQMLMISAGSNKLADVIDSACLIYFYMYSVKNVSLQPIISGFGTPVTLAGTFLAGGIAVRFGLKKTFILGAWVNLTITGLLLIIRPFSGNLVPLFILLMSLNSVCRRMTSQNVDPMIAEIIDYHNYKTGKFIPGIIGALFSFVDKMISSFGGTIVGVVMGFAGYSAGAEPTVILFWTTLLLYLAAPLFGDLVSVIAMRFYKIDKDTYKEMYGNKESKNAEVSGKETEAIQV